MSERLAPSDPLSSSPLDVFHRLFKPHPWHGVPLGEGAPERVNVFIEIVPTDTVKYELEKETGYLTVDRPQKYSNVCPSLYGFLPRTHCGERVAELCRSRTGRDEIAGDGDPMDVCVLSEKAFSHGDLFLKAIPIGGFRMIDGAEADDKIVAVLEGDATYGSLRELSDVPRPLLERLKHYFLTYKQAPGAEREEVEIPQTYGRSEAYEVIERSREDYQRLYGELPEKLIAGLRRLDGAGGGEGGA
ncbi:MAG: inorganic pyrophosphatase [Acidobacteriota bacterium]|jgi:inorganic pyrophosphatase